MTDATFFDCPVVQSPIGALSEPTSKTRQAALTEDIIEALKEVFDPEIPVNIYDLGLIYKIELSELNVASIDMTLTAPGCPVAGELVTQVQQVVNDVRGVDAVVVKLVFDPPWSQSMMSEEARVGLGFY